MIDALETGFAHGGGQAHIWVIDEAIQRLEFNEKLQCNLCGETYGKVSANYFSFNSPSVLVRNVADSEIPLHPDMDLVIPNKNLSIKDGAIAVWETKIAEWERKRLFQYCRAQSIPLIAPITISPRTFKVPSRTEMGTGSAYVDGSDGSRARPTRCVRVFLARHRTPIQCSTCNGARLKPVSLQYELGDYNMHELSLMSLDRLGKFFAELELPADQEANGAVLKEITDRLQYLNDVGVGLLDPRPPLKTLSGGEVQRVNLTTAIGSGLVNTLYVLDEPSVGLHPRDNERLLDILERLRSNRNTVVVIEHDEAIVGRADHVVDMGPGPGESGGQVVYQGPPSGLRHMDTPSMTAKMLTHEASLRSIPKRRKPTDFISVEGARENNLKGVDAAFGKHVLNVVTGVSGSGKSTLVVDTLVRGIQRSRAVSRAGSHEAIVGSEGVDNVILIDQSPVGKHRDPALPPT